MAGIWSLAASAALVALALAAGCRDASEAAPRRFPDEKDIGGTITVVGIARDAKLGALVETEGGVFWLDGVDAWPAGLSGRRVRVTGTLIRRRDLPVFVEKEGEPPVSGIPVPPGTDVSEAAARHLIKAPAWSAAD